VPFSVQEIKDIGLESDTVTVTSVFRGNRGNYCGLGEIFKQICGITAVTGSVCVVIPRKR